uniref:RHS repeat-associated core domain-containing protein n=1 Tax=Oscillatoriales cyanobacterium SpSt-418 TaxID=2282169 RepID=A0A7C3PUD7_9CYAN
MRTFTWDYRNRLVGVTDQFGTMATSTVSYIYDVLDRRIAKSVNGSGTQFVYDGDNVILEFNGTTIPSMRYLQGLGVDQTLAQEGNGQTSWMLTDHLGTVRDLVNNSGSVVNHFTYNSFGQVLNSTAGGVDTRYKYMGREFDAETGLYYYRARYFDASVGKFIGQDPIGFSAGDSNLYRYVGNSPLMATDPSGKVKIELVFKGASQLCNEYKYSESQFGSTSIMLGIIHSLSKRAKTWTLINGNKSKLMPVPLRLYCTTKPLPNR